MKSKTLHNNRIKYSGDIVAGSLLIAESRKIARLLLKGADGNAWHHAIVIDNILQKRSPVAAKRQARLIKNRLTLMKPELWELVDKSRSDVSIQALLSAAIKHSRLLGDFMGQVIHERWRTFNPEINVKDWKNYLDTCSQVNPEMLNWTESTRAKLKQIVFRILTESSYLDGTRSGKIQSVTVLPEIKEYLIQNSEDYVLRCMQVTQ